MRGLKTLRLSQHKIIQELFLVTSENFEDISYLSTNLTLDADASVTPKLTTTVEASQAENASVNLITFDEPSTKKGRASQRKFFCA